MHRWFLLLICNMLLLTACEKIAIYTTHKKQPIPSRSQLATTAQQQFWNTLHTGNYQHISDVDMLLTAAYLENPNDPLLASHLGFLHTWKITERQRLSNNSPTIVNEIILAKKYFKDAIELDSKDARLKGFFGDCQLVEGQIFNNQREQTRGYFTLKKAIHDWPEFNYFAGGFVLSNLPYDSKLFKEGLQWQWATMDLCAEQSVNRNNPDFSPYMKLATETGAKRACWNSWIAPHNFEGFFLNMGDMLVKAGDWQTAIKIYRNATLSPQYDQWPYKNLLEKRMRDAKTNVIEFRKTKNLSPEKSILFNSGYGCVACHQQ